MVRSVYAAGAQYIRPRAGAADSAPAMLAAFLRANLEYIRDHSTEIAAVAEIAINARTRQGAPRFTAGPGGIEQALRPLQDILRRGQAAGPGQRTLLICQTPIDAAMATTAVAPNRAG